MKKALFVIIAIFTLLCILSVSTLAAGTIFPIGDAVLLGDINGDGVVNKTLDTAAMQSKLLGETAGATEDINSDGSTDIVDLVCLYKYADTYANYANESGITIGSGSVEVTR